MTNYERAMEANRDDLLSTITKLEEDRRRIDKHIGDLESSRENLTKAIAAMKQLVANYDAEIRRGS